MSWYEIQQHDNELDHLVGSSGFTAETKPDARRVFRVTGYSPDLILRRGVGGVTSILNDSGVGLPDYGTPHPFRSDLYLTNYSSQSEDVLVFIATATYSKYIIERSGGFQNETYELPIALRHVKKVPGYQGAAEQNIIHWEFSTQAVIESHERMVCKVRLDAGDWGSTLALIRNQQNKLHKIQASWFRFEMPDYVQIGSGMMEVTYSFFGDTGIPVARTQVIDPGGPRQIFVPGQIQRDTELTGDTDWVRPPFNAIGMMPSAPSRPDQEPPDPIVFSVRGLEISDGGIGPDHPDGQGWRLLPGIPDLDR